MMAVKIQKYSTLSSVDMKPLIAESKTNGIEFVQRFVEEWKAGINQFNRYGEICLIAEEDNQLIGICGLNIDPYEQNTGIARVRHLYVLTEQRRRGIGKKLIKHIVSYAQQNFHQLNLRTTNPEADKFYLALGFERSTDSPYCTHRLQLRIQPA